MHGLARALPALIAVLALAVSACGAPPTGESDADASAAGAGTTYGVLASSCDNGRAAAEKRAGIETVTFELAWDRYEPGPQRFDEQYAAEVKRKVQICRQAGLKVILGLGLQYPPAWARDLPAARYIDQYGSPSTLGETNIVFSQAVRGAAAGYLRQVASDVGLDNFAALRLGTNRTGELGFPGPIDGNDEGAHDFWGFDTAAQTGQGLAAGMSTAPMPGWVPGMTEWKGRPVTTEQTTAWFNWYTSSLVKTIAWQADLLVGLGFAGEFHLPIPGRGTLPADRTQALAHHLDGRNDPDGNLERGLDYPHQFAQLSQLDKRLSSSNERARVVVDFTGLDDVSAVRARATGNDVCRADDTDGLLTRPGVEDWASQRWTVANARLVGLPVIGENPGPPDAAHTGGASDSDEVADQLRYALQYADSCQLGQFLWAFEDQLFDEASGVGLDDYARAIATRK